LSAVRTREMPRGPQIQADSGKGVDGRDPSGNACARQLQPSAFSFQPPPRRKAGLNTHVTLVTDELER
jgi:hypothetical protein